MKNHWIEKSKEPRVFYVTCSIPEANRYLDAGWILAEVRDYSGCTFFTLGCVWKKLGWPPNPGDL